MGTDNEEKRICCECVAESFLREEIASTGPEAECGYCGERAASYTIRELADRVHTMFSTHYERTSTEPDSMQLAMHHNRELDYDWEREGQRIVDLIVDVAEIPARAAEEIREILAEDHWDAETAQMGDESEYDENALYEEKAVSGKRWENAWLRIEHSLLRQARFFNAEAASRMEEVFKGLEEMETRDSTSVLSSIGPGSSIAHVVRARVFQTIDSLYEALCRPDLHIGPPPSHGATSGRMNPAGVSVFYGATEPRVAIAEVRPPVGSYVVVAKFGLLRPLRVLDLAAASRVMEKGSLFDPEFTHRLERAEFLKELARRIAKPVMPVDEAADYLPSQAVADYLANRHSPRIDGIVFPSVQARSPGANVVLFHHASRVKPLNIPEGTEIRASRPWASEDGPEDYCVWEAVPEDGGKREARHEDPQFVWLPGDGEEEVDLERDDRDEALAVLAGDVYVHQVRSVELETSKDSVRRYRERNDGDF